MIRDLILEIAPILIIAVILIFSFMKISIISVSLNKNYFELFFTSFLFFNKVTIKNTFHERLKRFYKRSNQLNKIFYSILAVIIAIYLMMKAI